MPATATRARASTSPPEDRRRLTARCKRARGNKCLLTLALVRRLDLDDDHSVVDVRGNVEAKSRIGGDERCFPRRLRRQVVRAVPCGEILERRTSGSTSERTRPTGSKPSKLDALTLATTTRNEPGSTASSAPCGCTEPGCWIGSLAQLSSACSSGGRTVFVMALRFRKSRGRDIDNAPMLNKSGASP